MCTEAAAAALLSPTHMCYAPFKARQKINTKALQESGFLFVENSQLNNNIAPLPFRIHE